MAKPLVTIITPAYNCGKFVGQTIRSILSQDYENIEYIVLDDCSTDATLAIINNYNVAYIAFLQGVSIFRNKINIGEQKTVNKALDIVKGKYFMIVNADDPLLPGAISKLVAFMETNPDILCAYPDWESINEDGSHRAYIKSREYDFKYMVNHHTCLPSAGSMFRSSILKTIRRDESYHWLGDFDFWLKIGFAGPMAHVSETLATWRHREGQASGEKSDARAKEHIRIAAGFCSEARCWAYLVAAVVTDRLVKTVYYILKAGLSHPLIVFNIEFIHTLIKRAIYILRR